MLSLDHSTNNLVSWYWLVKTKGMGVSLNPAIEDAYIATVKTSLSGIGANFSNCINLNQILVSLKATWLSGINGVKNVLNF